jgi:hypothetical protein
VAFRVMRSNQAAGRGRTQQWNSFFLSGTLPAQ